MSAWFSGLIGLIATLTVRARADELATLREIGCANGTLALMIAAEFLALGLAGVGLAVLAAAFAGGFAERLLLLFA